MIDLVIFAVFFGVLALMSLIRLIIGPTAADRMVAADCADITVCCAMVLFSLYTGRGIYLDIAVISALLGIIDTILVAKYLDKGRWRKYAAKDRH